ncbi:MAG: hypothetical protein ACR2RE_17565 [Geminicoccaceae bacterium]
MTRLFSRDFSLDENDIRETVAEMSRHEICVLLQAVVEGLFGARTVDEASRSHEAIQEAREALEQCSLDVAKGLRIIAGILSEKFDLEEDGLGSGEGE